MSQATLTFLHLMWDFVVILMWVTWQKLYFHFRFHTWDNCQENLVDNGSLIRVWLLEWTRVDSTESCCSQSRQLMKWKHDCCVGGSWFRHLHCKLPSGHCIPMKGNRFKGQEARPALIHLCSFSSVKVCFHGWAWMNEWMNMVWSPE